MFIKALAKIFRASTKNEAKKPIWLFVGLGNPGRAYENTRHNLGFMTVAKFAEDLGWSFKREKRLQSLLAKGVINGVTVVLLQPETYMNLSGQAVRNTMDYYKIESIEIVVVCDDMAVPFGTLRFRPKGSSGGHNGLKSIIGSLGSDQFARLRMGIGKVKIDNKQSIEDFVLSPFSYEEFQTLDGFIKKGVETLISMTRLSLQGVKQ